VWIRIGLIELRASHGHAPEVGEEPAP
jgi:hypothetical protein